MTAAALDMPDDLRPQRPKGLGVGALLALAVHAGLILALAFGVNWRNREPQGVSAELWSAVPQAAAPREQLPPTPPSPPAPPPQPKPTPQPRREAPPPAPTQRDADIATEKTEREKQRREAEAREEEQARRVKEKAAQEKAKQQAAQAAAQAQADKLADEKRRKADEALAAKQREANLKRMQGLAGATGAPDAQGTAQQSSGPSASYAGRIVARVRPNVVFTDDIPGNPEAEVEVRAAPDGTVLGRKLVKSSGVKAWDDAVLRAIDRTDTLPRDTDGRMPARITIVFKPRM